jgi:RND family efflux transporter MFP subunit
VALLTVRRKELQAALADAEAKVLLAEATLGRYRRSVDQGAVTRQALDEASAAAGAARAAVELARARIGALDIELRKSELRAPFDAVVARRLADEGQVLAAGSPVLELQERAVPEVRVGVAGPLAAALQPGATYRLHWRHRDLAARLRTATTRTVEVLLVPLNAPPGLHPGELVELELTQWVADPGFWLPATALAEGTRGLWQAYATEPLTETALSSLAADHRVTPRPIEVLYLDGDRVYARGPLQDGERIVRAGVQRVVPGQLVRVLGQSEPHLAMETQ